MKSNAFDFSIKMSNALDFAIKYKWKIFPISLSKRIKFDDKKAQTSFDKERILLFYGLLLEYRKNPAGKEVWFSLSILGVKVKFIRAKWWWGSGGGGGGGGGEGGGETTN